MQKIIVTGGLGFIGSNLIELLLKNNYYVINIDKVSYSSNYYNVKEFDNNNYNFIKCNVNNRIKIRNISLARGLIIVEVISAMERPFSFRLTTSAPKSCTAPIKMVPITIQTRAGSQPQYAAMQGPIMGAAPAMDVK